MIHRTDSAVQQEKWKIELGNAITSPLELLRLLDLDKTDLARQLDSIPEFRLRVPRCFVSRMRKADPDDPLLRQVLPLAIENRISPGFVKDPVGDLQSETVPGVLHKYHGRALLVTTGACGIHCRYCFRRHFPYSDSNPSVDQWRQALSYIRQTDSISEVLLSGGDPLSLSDQKLSSLIKAIELIPHVKRLRIHSRMPVVLPARIEPQFLNMFDGSRLKTIMVIHANHANEIDVEVHKTMSDLRDSGMTLLNQSVLLRKVNDNVDALADLSEKLFEFGVLPYYLHLLDPVQGAAHFNIEQNEAMVLINHLRTRLPGYMVPRLVWEKPGAAFKITII